MTLLAKRHLIETGFTRIYEGDEDLSQPEISNYFDKKYDRCPSFKNEYLTQNKPPATGTKAIREVIKHLIEDKDLKANSVELAMVQELFRKDVKIKCIRDEIEIFIHRAEVKSNIQELYTKLSSEPYGLTKTIISLLLLDVLLKQGDKVSLYEKNAFSLEITPLLFDRLMANPQNFELQKNIFDGEKRKYIELLSETLLKENTSNLLHLVKGIVVKVRELEKFTKQTTILTKTTERVRNIIMNAKEPHALIFRDLKRFSIDELKQSFDEMDSCYNSLIQEIESFLFESLSIKVADKEALETKFKNIFEYISNDELKIFANNILIDDLPYNRWLERVATVVNKKRVPKDWCDNDLADFKQKIKEIAIKTQGLENLTGKNSIDFDKVLNSVYKAVKKLSKPQQLALVREITNA